MLGPIAKDPDGTEVAGLDWETELNGATIASSSWVLASGLTESTNTNTTTTTQIKFTGAEAGRKYLLTNRIITNGGATYDRTLLVVGMPR